MKIAKLPGGKTLPFGVDVPDEVIDRTVKAYLGVVDEDVPRPEAVALMDVAQRLVSMQEQANLISQAVMMLQQSVADQSAQLGQAVAQMSQTSSDFASRMEEIARIMSAPKAVMWDDKGRIVGVHTVNKQK